MRKNTTSLSSRLQFSLLALACCFLPLAAAAEPLRVGVCLALTGEGARWSAAHRAGIELAAADAAAAGQLVEVIIDDTGTSAAGSVTCATRMLKVERVNALIGNVWGFLTLPMIPIAEQAKVPLVSTGLMSQSCPKNSPHFFTVSEQLDDLSPAYAAFFERHKQLRKIAIIAFDDGEWGKYSTQAVERAAESTGRSVVEIFPTQEMRPDFLSVLPKMLSKKPDVIFVFHEPLSSTLALRKLNFPGAVVQANTIGEQLWDTGKAPEALEGAYFADGVQPREFETKFNERFRKLPVLEAHSGYDALSILVQANVRNSADLAAGLRAGPLAGVRSEINFHKSCSGKHTRWEMFQIQDGRKVRLNIPS